MGCCSLRVEHITLHEQLDGNECVVEFDFLGKDCIRYYNKVPVIKKVKEEMTNTLALKRVDAKQCSHGCTVVSVIALRSQMEAIFSLVSH